MKRPWSIQAMVHPRTKSCGTDAKPREVMGFRNTGWEQKALVNSRRRFHGWCENIKNGQRVRLRRGSKRGTKEKCRAQNADTGMGVGVANGEKFPGLKKPAKQVHLS